MLQAFQHDTRGAVAVIFGITSLLLVVAGGAAIDYSIASSGRAELQTQADSAALAAAREFITQAASPLGVQEQSAKRVAEQFLRSAGLNGRSVRSFRSRVDADARRKIVVVELEAGVEAHFMQVVGVRGTDIRVSATAVADVRADPLCILALDRKAQPGIEFVGAGDLDAKDCVVWSNSTSRRSIAAAGAGSVVAKRICAAGEVSRAGVYSFKPTPEEHCRVVDDPLASWVPPAPGACKSALDVISPGVVELDPGTYCGGISVVADQIKFHPGVYIVKDGPLRLASRSRIEGTDVGLYLTGKNARLDFSGTAVVEISAAATGPMAGIAIAQNPLSAPGSKSSMTGNMTLQIYGLIYFPTQVQSVWGNSKSVSDTSGTAIVAKQIEIGGNGYLRVNIDRNLHDAFSRYVYANNTGVRLVR